MGYKFTLFSTTLQTEHKQLTEYPNILLNTETLMDKTLDIQKPSGKQPMSINSNYFCIQMLVSRHTHTQPQTHTHAHTHSHVRGHNGQQTWT